MMMSDDDWWWAIMMSNDDDGDDDECFRWVIIKSNDDNYDNDEWWWWASKKVSEKARDEEWDSKRAKKWDDEYGSIICKRFRKDKPARKLVRKQEMQSGIANADWDRKDEYGVKQILERYAV